MRHTPPLQVVAVVAAATLACAPPKAVIPSNFTGSQSGPTWAEATLARMSLRDKAAQMVWPTVLGVYQGADSREWLWRRDRVVTDKVGGFTVSLGSPFDIAALTNRLQSMSAVPLLFAADLEFGAGYRARAGYFMPNAIDMGGAVVFPPQMALGAAGDTALAYEQGRITAIEGRAIGIHVNYSPILDVNSNPKNPVINTRSYGEDPRLVARLGAAFIRGTQTHGMIATGKHFPGHGDTDVNSHLGLPVISATRARLDSIDLPPFAAAIRAGVGAIMSFHGAMLALDSTGAPGTLSHAVMTRLLREQLRFEGLVFSDAMDMRGVLDKYGAEEATIRAVEAGADILIQPLDASATIDAIVAGVRRGRYDVRRLDRSVLAILRAKESLRLPARRLVDMDSVRTLVGIAPHLAAAHRAAERSITLAKDSLGQVPLRLGDSTRVLSVTVAQRHDVGAGTSFNAELRGRFPRLRAEFVDADSPELEHAFARLLRDADSADAVVVGSYVSHAWDKATIAAPQSLAAFIQSLIGRGKPPVLVAFGNPYWLLEVPHAPAYLIAWGGFPVSQRAAGRALLGAIPITGTMPVSIPPFVSIGPGLRRER